MHSYVYNYTQVVGMNFVNFKSRHFKCIHHSTLRVCYHTQRVEGTSPVRNSLA